MLCFFGFLNINKVMIEYKHEELKFSHNLKRHYETIRMFWDKPRFFFLINSTNDIIREL